MGISSGVGDVLAPVSYGFRNVIINGNFSINQRVYASGTNLASGSYGFDRWKSTFTNTALTFTSAPQGQLVTISSGGSIEQVVERANVPAGSYVLSWSGTARGRVYNSGSTPPAYAASPVFVTLDGTANVEVEFAPASGTATLGEVQLERGQRQTPFEFRPVGVELALCQRYYERTWRSMHIGMGVNENGTVATFVNIPIYPKRSSTLTVTSTGSLFQHWGGTGGTYAGYDYETPELFMWVKYTSAPLSANAVGMMYLNNGYIDVSAEL